MSPDCHLLFHSANIRVPILCYTLLVLSTACHGVYEEGRQCPWESSLFGEGFCWLKSIQHKW